MANRTISPRTWPFVLNGDHFSLKQLFTIKATTLAYNPIAITAV